MRVSLSMATVREREEWAREWLDWAVTQPVDHIRVYLDGYSRRPSWLRGDDRIETKMKPRRRAAGKLAWAGDDCVHVTTDDDIVYPADYVDQMLAGLERHPGAVVCMHGSIVRSHYQSHYSRRARRAISYQRQTPEDVQVHLPGTGCSAWDGSLVDLTDDGTMPLIGVDSWAGVRAREQGAEVWVLAHEPIASRGECSSPTLVRSGSRGDGSEYDASETQTRIVLGAAPWPQLLGGSVAPTGDQLDCVRAAGVPVEVLGSLHYEAPVPRRDGARVVEAMRAAGIDARWGGGQSVRWRTSRGQWADLVLGG